MAALCYSCATFLSFAHCTLCISERSEYGSKRDRLFANPASGSDFVRQRKSPKAPILCPHKLSWGKCPANTGSLQVATGTHQTISDSALTSICPPPAPKHPRQSAATAHEATAGGPPADGNARDIDSITDIDDLNEWLQAPSSRASKSQRKMVSNGSTKTGSTQVNSQWMAGGTQQGQQAQESQSQIPYTELQSGSIDLVDLQENGLEVDDASEPSQLDGPSEAFPDNQLFKHPETPAVGSKTRPLELTTPGLPANPFAQSAGPEKGALNPTQAFKMTQAPTSPLPPGAPSEASERPSPALHFPTTDYATLLPSDLVSEKPSPMLLHVGRPSSAHALTSPLDTRKPSNRPVTEPHEVYRSLRESQEARGVRNGLPRDKDPEETDILEQEFASTSPVRSKRSALGKRRRGEHADGERDLVSQRPPSRNLRRADRSSSAHEVALPSAVSPQNSTRRAAEEPAANATEEETEREDPIAYSDTEGHDELGDENKENLNVKRTPRRAVRSTPRRATKRPIPPHSGSDEPHSHPSTYSSPDELADETPSKRPKPSPKANVRSPDVPDSQNSQRLNNRQRNLRPVSSGESRKIVPQSQPFQKPTSHSQPMLSQNAIATPPSSGNSTRQRQARQKNAILHSLPSSPPRVASPRSSHNRSLEADGMSRHTGIPSERFLGKSSEDISKPSSGAEQSCAPARSMTMRDLTEGPVPTPFKIPSTIPETEFPSKTGSRRDSAAYSTRGSGARRNFEPDMNKSAQHADSTSELHAFATAPSHQSRALPTADPSEDLRPLEASSQNAGAVVPTLLGDIASRRGKSEEFSSLNIDDFQILPNEYETFKAELRGFSSPTASAARPAVKRNRVDKRPIVPGHASSDQPLVNGINAQRERKNAVRASPEAPGRSEKGSQAPIDSGRASGASRTKPINHVARVLPESSSPIRAKALEKKTRRSSTEQDPSFTNVSEHAPAAIETSNPGLEAHATKNLRTSLPPVETPTKYSAPATLEAVPYPRRVFALFNGTPAGYFPATCLAVVNEKGANARFEVRFDDGTVATVNDFKVKKLQLAPGDNVKVDRRGLRNQTFVVVRFEESSLNTTSPRPISAFPKTDVEGHEVVWVRPKQPSGKKEGKEVAVPVTEVYFANMMWAAFQSRGYQHPAAEAKCPKVADLIIPDSATPSAASALRRRLKQPGKSSTGKRLSTAPDTPVGRSGSLFSGIVFAFTGISDPGARSEVKMLIRKHGGHLLEGDQGFEELFDVPSFTKFPTTAKSTSSGGPSSNTSSNAATPTSSYFPIAGQEFTLKPSFANTRSAVLLAEDYSRSTKYIQALALGVPCLAVRWLRLCVSHRRLAPWRPFLLASGESSYLGGSRCSRTLNYAVNPADGDTDSAAQNLEDLPTLGQMLAHRPVWLSGRSVLLVGGNKIAAYLFLAYALGAARVGVARTVPSQRAGDWDWMCVAEDEGHLDASNDSRHTSKKRKRGKDAGSPRVSEGKFEQEGLRNPKIVGTEYVVQSLILGHLLEGLE